MFLGACEAMHRRKKGALLLHVVAFPTRCARGALGSSIAYSWLRNGREVRSTKFATSHQRSTVLSTTVDGSFMAYGSRVRDRTGVRG
jgi:hypothetical protein